ALAHLPETRDTREQAIDLRFALRNALGPSGDLGRVLALLREAEALAAVLDDPRRLGQVSLFLCNYFYIMGAHDQALAAGHRGLGALYGQTGQGEQARTELWTAISLYRTMEMTFWLPQTEAALAQVEGR